MVVADTVVSLGVIASIYALLALGMNVKYGHTGLLDFGHVAFFLIGAYGAALFVLPPDQPGDFTRYLFGLDLPWVVAAVFATAIAALVGAYVALPTLRLREDYLAITVLGVSVILQRIVQAESWLVNGPDSLRGIQQPLKEFFPLAGRTLSGAVAFFLIGGAIWAFSTYVLGRTLEGAGHETRTTAGRRLYALATLGTGRLFEGYASDGSGHSNRTLSAVVAPGRDRQVLSALVAGGVVGLVGGVLTWYTSVGLLALGAVISVYTWLVLLVGLGWYTADFEAIDYVATLALGAGYMLALAPMYYLESIAVWIPLTLVVFGVVIGATIYLRRNWARFRDRPTRYAIVAGLWFGAIWYFPLQVLSPLRAGRVVPAATTVFNNVVWMLGFSGEIPYIGYSRFQLFLFGTIVIACVGITDLLVESPFGRVLRAVRNDEDTVNALGKNPFMYKVQSMAIGSAFAGLAGVMAGLYYQTLVFTMFAPRVTFIALLIMFLGGIGNNRAMIVGALLFWAFQTATTQLSSFVAPEFRTRIQALRFVIMGVLFLLLLYYRPEGLMGERSRTEMSGE